MFLSGTNEGKLWAKVEAGAKTIKFGSFCGNVSFFGRLYIPRLISCFVVTNQDKSLLDQAPSGNEPPSLKGYLSKYTNVAKGYNTRWFVLKNGILSCKSLV